MTQTRPWPIPGNDALLVHHISDTHFGYRPWSYAEGDHMLRDLREGLVPVADLDVHTGDVTDNGADVEDTYARSWLKALSAPKQLVAMGNHDIRSRKVHTRATWERVYGRPANSYLDVKGWRFVTFAVDDFTGTDAPWTVPAATWDWVDSVVSSAPGPVVLAQHYPPKELGVVDNNAVQPASRLDDLVGSHPSIVGLLTGHMHWEIDDPRAARFVTIGGRSVPVLMDISSMLSLDGRSRDQSAQVQSHSAYVTMYEDRWEVRYRAHGTHAWSGPSGQRATVLDLPTGTVARGM